MKPDLVRFGDQQTAIRHIRNAVFSVEQGVDPTIDFDGLDHEAIQVLCCNNNGVPIGTGRMLDDGHIGRVAVLKDYRSQRVGSSIMTLLIDTARTRQFERVYLYAQVNAVPFYEKLGFTLCDEDVMEAGILHTLMEMWLNK